MKRIDLLNHKSAIYKPDNLVSCEIYTEYGVGVIASVWDIKRNEEEEESEKTVIINFANQEAVRLAEEKGETTTRFWDSGSEIIPEALVQSAETWERVRVLAKLAGIRKMDGDFVRIGKLPEPFEVVLIGGNFSYYQWPHIIYYCGEIKVITEHEANQHFLRARNDVYNCCGTTIVVNEDDMFIFVDCRKPSEKEESIKKFINKIVNHGKQ